MVFDAAAARALMPQQNFERTLDAVLARIEIRAKEGQSSCLFNNTLIPDVSDWSNSRPSPIADHIVAALTLRDFKVKHFHSEDDGPNRPGWDGIEVQW